MEQGRLAGRTAVVTGGAHGIGRAYSMRFAEEGAQVAIFDLDEAAAQATADEIKAADGDAMACQADVSDPASIQRAVEEVIRGYQKIDILVNNAAVFSVVPMSRAPFDQVSIEEWDLMMAVNVKGPWLMCRAVAPHMRKQGYGKIINISSGSVFKGMATQIHYVTSKAAILGLTRNLARELGGDGITVNNIAPGSTLSEEDPTEEIIAFRESARASRAIQRTQSPMDLPGAAVFLASSDSDFMTGQTLVVDGGSVML
ncbi:MAG: SDR family oxidoreductase [Streptosporangiales bacterium]|nr:SDR family oxidoreductase [Streptosporangiales bacterium]